MKAMEHFADFARETHGQRPMNKLQTGAIVMTAAFMAEAAPLGNHGTLDMPAADVHCHFTTPGYLAMMEKHGAQLDELYPIPAWSSEALGAFLDEAGIGLAVLTSVAPQPHFGDAAESAAACREWMRRVGGRLEMRYSYSKNIVYNTFAWPNPTEEQRKRVEATAQSILNARANHPESSFADLYDDTAMPLDLRNAHRANDVAVCEAYGWLDDISEEEIVAALFRLYHELTTLRY